MNRDPTLLYLPFVSFKSFKKSRKQLATDDNLLTSRERPKSASYLRLKNIQGRTIVKFFNYHTVPKSTQKSFPRNSKRAFFLNWKHQKKTNLPFEKKFQKKYLVKKSHIAEKPKERPFRLKKRFYKPKASMKFKRYPLKEFKNFPRKVA